MKGNSLVLHFASLTVHKVTVIFTDRLKRDKEGLFCSLNAFDSDYHTCSKVFPLKLASVPSHNMIIWSRNRPFIVVLRWNENGDPPFLSVFFTCYEYTKNIF